VRQGAVLVVLYQLLKCLLSCDCNGDTLLVRTNYLVKVASLSCTLLTDTLLRLSKYQTDSVQVTVIE
jgi:hypothetical protein